ncbi:hypothetical protein KC318_g7091 [Hortaea werneckii]|nr:hypothetical protein KC334_g7432 [Hortaea werneckii]KAI6979960.1 hypothetical protein KC355_g11093 [Hortaea werneckii]KAI7182285.1 hypothetical protein KC324_g8277 [Hortaea werneckii]KAI7588385.1 hypothetical protein KC316_g4496 [Hortaea werneckii]KAI7665492.1 hypothetical protein KC318_g7091 [Hortaea werneckii]
MPKFKYPCRICQQIFKTSDMLEQHGKRTLHRVYTCPVETCERTYYRRDVYIRHKSTHEQKALHVCYFCATEGQDKAFKRKDHLNQHIRNCHPRMDPCPVIGGGFNITSGCEPHHSGRPPPNRNGFQQCGFKDQNGFQEYEAIFGAGNLTAQQIPSDSFQSSAAAKLEEALTDIVVDGHDLRVLKEKLDLHNRSTPEQLASNLRKLVEAS